jgi:ubiquinone/menaquinone biosynthesis C-methylase UbiE
MVFSIFLLYLYCMHTYTTYNKVAWFYDGLCRLVLGSMVKKSQTDLLSFIPANASILLVGGGTGWILEEITKLHPAGLQITYVDISSKMIEHSKKRNVGTNTLEFITAPIENIDLAGCSYDIIFTPFLLDGLLQSTYHTVFKKLDACLKTGGKWLYVDFQISDTSSFWQKALLKFMYLFFRLSCKIEAVRLPVVDIDFAAYRVLNKRTYGKDFIISLALQK